MRVTAVNTIKRQGGIIQDWEVIDTYNGFQYVVGNIFDDEIWSQGVNIRTSVIVEIKDNILETKNTFYKLGNPRNKNLDESPN